MDDESEDDDLTLKQFSSKRQKQSSEMQTSSEANAREDGASKKTPPTWMCRGYDHYILCPERTQQNKGGKFQAIVINAATEMAMKRIVEQKICCGENPDNMPALKTAIRSLVAHPSVMTAYVNSHARKREDARLRVYFAHAMMKIHQEEHLAWDMEKKIIDHWWDIRDCLGRSKFMVFEADTTQCSGSRCCRAKFNERVEQEVDQGEQKTGRDLSEKLLSPLTGEEEGHFAWLMKGSKRPKIGEAYENICHIKENGTHISPQDPVCLKSEIFMNDGIIEYFFRNLPEIVKNEGGKLQGQCFFFGSKLLRKIYDEEGKKGIDKREYEYGRVRNWLWKKRRTDIFAWDKLFIPIHKRPDHWLLGVVSIPEKAITVCDSLLPGGRSDQDRNKACLEDIFKLLQDEHRASKRTALPEAERWTLELPSEKDPQQNDGKFIIFADVFIFFLGFMQFFEHDRTDSSDNGFLLQFHRR